MARYLMHRDPSMFYYTATFYNHRIDVATTLKATMISSYVTLP